MKTPNHKFAHILQLVNADSLLNRRVRLFVEGFVYRSTDASEGEFTQLATALRAAAVRDSGARCHW